MHPSIEKELSNSDKFRDNLQRVAAWRFAAVLKQGRYCRESLDKAFSLSGHTGHPAFDLWVYVVQSLPWFIPATFVLIPSIFAGFVALVSGALSLLAKEPKIIEKTIEVPFLFFFTVTKTISETIMVPKIPDARVSTTVAVLVIILVLVLLSWALKHIFLIELAYRRRLLLRHVDKNKFQ